MVIPAKAGIQAIKPQPPDPGELHAGDTSLYQTTADRSPGFRHCSGFTLFQCHSPPPSRPSTPTSEGGAYPDPVHPFSHRLSHGTTGQNVLKWLKLGYWAGFREQADGEGENGGKLLKKACFPEKTGLVQWSGSRTLARPKISDGGRWFKPHLVLP